MFPNLAYCCHNLSQNHVRNTNCYIPHNNRYNTSPLNCRSRHTRVYAASLESPRLMYHVVVTYSNTFQAAYKYTYRRSRPRSFAQLSAILSRSDNHLGLNLPYTPKDIRRSYNRCRQRHNRKVHRTLQPYSTYFQPNHRPHKS